LDNREDEIKHLYQGGVTKASIARYMKISYSALNKFMSKKGINKENGEAS